VTTSHRFYPSGTPRFNHVALSLPAEQLSPSGRAELCRFFGEVLGFDELPTMTVDGRRLVLSCVHWDQFLFLVGEDDPMRCPPLDHFGFALGTLDELDAAHRRALEFAADDGRLQVEGIDVDDQGPVKIHSVYLGYVLPMRIELQWWEFT